MTRTYSRRDGKYVLEELVIESETKTDKATIRGKQHMRFRNVKWKENKEKDAERKEKREKAPKMALLAPPSAPSFSWGCEDGAIYDQDGNPCYADGGGGGGGGGGGYTDPCPAVAGGQNILLQHGFKSEGAVWGRMQNWLRCDWQLNQELVPDLNWKARHVDQGTDLRNRIVGTQQSGFVLIGHSQGGLIARHAAQRLFLDEGQPHLIEGVVSLGTPHQGALLAHNLKAGALDGLYLLYGVAGQCGNRFLDASCHISTYVTQQFLSGWLTGVMDATYPAANDLQPGSSALNGINSRSEGFARYGIQHYPHKRWMLIRLWRDLGNNPDEAGGGRRWVRYAEWTYQGLRVCNYASIFFGQFQLTQVCGKAHRALDITDRWWDNLTAPGMRSDGIVQGPSQVYPNALEQRPVNAGDSHVGEVKSPETRRELNYLLGSKFSVQPRSK